MAKVVIYQHRLLHYRVNFFEALRSRLRENGVELELVYGQATPTEATRKDEGELSWGHIVKNRSIRARGVDILWQPIVKSIFKAELVVLMQENRIISNYVILVIRKMLRLPTAYWGHGKNFQNKSAASLRESWKRFMVNKIDWWFAYTKISVDYLTSNGVPRKIITNLDNAIDVRSFKNQLSSITDNDVEDFKRGLGIPSDAVIGLFCGSLYPEKRIPFLLESSAQIRKIISNFHLIVIGNGPSAHLIEDASKQNDWIHYLGVLRGIEKARAFRIASAQLNPGLVGLHVLDAFSAGLPMITLSSSLHSPEIAYLINGKNGLIIDGDDPSRFALLTAKCLNDVETYSKMRNSCLADSEKYTVENMVRNFSAGIMKSLHMQ